MPQPRKRWLPSKGDYVIYNGLPYICRVRTTYDGWVFPDIPADMPEKLYARDGIEPGDYDERAFYVPVGSCIPARRVGNGEYAPV